LRCYPPVKYNLQQLKQKKLAVMSRSNEAKAMLNSKRLARTTISMSEENKLRVVTGDITRLQEIEIPALRKALVELEAKRVEVTNEEVEIKKQVDLGSNCLKLGYATFCCSGPLFAMALLISFLFLSKRMSQ